MCNMRFLILIKNKAFRKNHLKMGGQEVATSGYCASKDVGVHAVEFGPYRKIKTRRQMAAAAGKKSATSLSLFMEVFGLEVDKELSTLAPGY